MIALLLVAPALLGAGLALLRIREEDAGEGAQPVPVRPAPVVLHGVEGRSRQAEAALSRSA